MHWIQLIVIETHLSKFLNDISKENDITFQVQVLVITHRVHVKFRPNSLGMIVVFITNIPVGKMTEEFVEFEFVKFEFVRAKSFRSFSLDHPYIRMDRHLSVAIT